VGPNTISALSRIAQFLKSLTGKLGRMTTPGRQRIAAGFEKQANGRFRPGHWAALDVI
jgi:hypothetical protein